MAAVTTIISLFVIGHLRKCVIGGCIGINEMLFQVVRHA